MNVRSAVWLAVLYYTSTPAQLNVLHYIPSPMNYVLALVHVWQLDRLGQLTAYTTHNARIQKSINEYTKKTYSPCK